MSDDSSILGAVVDAGKDFVKEVGKQIAGSATSSVKSATQQVGGFDTQEQEAKKKAEQAATYQRVKQIEAEMAQIRAQNQQKQGPQLETSKPNSSDELQNSNNNSLDEASRQAIGKAEQGRNFKG